MKLFSKEAEVSIQDDVLRVSHTDLKDAQWRLGYGAGDSGREFGEASAAGIDQAGAITVDFRVRIPPDLAVPEVESIHLFVANGVNSGGCHISPGAIRFVGIKEPVLVNTEQWVDIRIVLDGNTTVYFAGDQTFKKTFQRENVGRYILFGVPQWNEKAGAELQTRGFELQRVKWYPRQAIMTPP